jgi:hypothetical protein
MSLREKLDEIRAGGMARIPADKLAVMQQATVDLRASGIMDKVIKIGSPLPAFTLTNMRGVSVTSGDLLSRGAVVLSVFRGHW